MSKTYFLATGEADRQRLTILNQLYNPPALQFLQDCGLKPGMTVLEVGCGTGHMACDLARYLGPHGKVIAIDSSPEQITVAKKTAQQEKIDNIEFHVCNVMELDKLALNYDATYGRWVIEFTQQPVNALALMYQYLNKGGLLAYEATNMLQTAYFSYPYQTIIEKWHEYGPKMFASYGYNTHFGDEAYSVFSQLKCQQLKARINQALLTNATEKSVYRLGLYTSKPTLLEKKIMTEEEIESLAAQFVSFEESSAISGFYRNILVSGIK